MALLANESASDRQNDLHDICTRRVRAAAGVSVLLTLTLTLSGCGVTSSNRPDAVASQTTSVNSATATTSPPAGSPGFGVIAFQGSFYQTTDGGGHWSAANTPALPTAAEPVNFELGAANRWIAATQFGATSATITVVRSNDSGASWQTSTITDTKDSYARPLSLQFTDAQHGWLAVDESQGNIRVGSLYGTSDGGASWTSFALPFSGDVTFTSQTDGWLVGGKFSTLRDMVAVTHDGGQIWTRQQVVATPAQGYNPILGSPTFFDAQDGVLPVDVGVSTDIYVTHDGGATWSVGHSFPNAPNEYGAAIFDTAWGHSLWVSSGQSLYVTHDDGATWTTSPSGAAIVGATSFAFVSDSTGWALTENGYCANGKTGCGTKIALLRTTDGGASWTPVQVAGLTS